MRSLLGSVLQGAEGGNGPLVLVKTLLEQWKPDSGPGGSIVIFMGMSTEPRVD